MLVVAGSSSARNGRTPRNTKIENPNLLFFRFSLQERLARQRLRTFLRANGIACPGIHGDAGVVTLRVQGVEVNAEVRIAFAVEQAFLHCVGLDPFASL